MKLYDRFEIIENYPALYMKEKNMLVIADLHLGLESLMADSGMLMPKVQLSQLKEDLNSIAGERDIEKLVVCGDIKHEFSEASYGEKKEVRELIRFLEEFVREIYLVKGNHDNFLIYAVEEYEHVQLKDCFVFDDVCFAHGHEILDRMNGLDIEYLVIGHEHPALTLRDDVGVREKLQCFLYGEMKNDAKLVVLPAFSELAEGSQVNQIEEEDLLSPVLKEMIDIEEMKAVGIDREAGLFEFPRLEEIKHV